MYVPTAKEKKDWSTFAYQSRSTAISTRITRPGSESASVLRRPKKACILPPLRCSVVITHPSELVTQNRVDRVPTKSLGSQLILRTSATNRGGGVGAGSPMAAAGGGNRSHWGPRGQFLGGSGFANRAKPRNPIESVKPFLDAKRRKSQDLYFFWIFGPNSLTVAHFLPP